MVGCDHSTLLDHYIQKAMSLLQFLVAANCLCILGFHRSKQAFIFYILSCHPPPHRPQSISRSLPSCPLQPSYRNPTSRFISVPGGNDRCTEEQPNMILFGGNRDMVGAVNRDECRDACLAKATPYNCKAAIYYPSRSECLLYDFNGIEK